MWALNRCSSSASSAGSLGAAVAAGFRVGGHKICRGHSTGAFRNSLEFENKPANEGFYDGLGFPRFPDALRDRILPANPVSVDEARRRRRKLDSERTAAFHEKMVQRDPGNALILRNYARFLQEEGELDKAEEFYERAILANPSDGEVLSLYAEFIWKNHRDVKRAENYFRQATQANPNDCYVASAYAYFLWNSEDEEEEQHESSPFSVESEPETKRSVNDAKP